MTDNRHSRTDERKIERGRNCVCCVGVSCDAYVFKKGSGLGWESWDGECPFVQTDGQLSVFFFFILLPFSSSIHPLAGH